MCYIGLRYSSYFINTRISYICNYSHTLFLIVTSTILKNVKCILHFLGLVLVLQYRQRKDFEEGKYNNAMCRTTLTFSFFSSLSDGNLWETRSFTEPSLNMLPKPMPLIFFGWAMIPLPWWGDVGLDAPSMLSVNTLLYEYRHNKLYKMLIKKKECVVQSKL